MRGPLSFVTFLIALIWGCYRCFQMKSERYLYGVLIFCILQLCFYPLWLPFEWMLSALCSLGFGGLLYKIFFQKQDKHLLIFAGIFFVSSLYFCAEGFLNPHTMKSDPLKQNKLHSAILSPSRKYEKCQGSTLNFSQVQPASKQTISKHMSDREESEIQWQSDARRFTFSTQLQYNQTGSNAR